MGPQLHLAPVALIAIAVAALSHTDSETIKSKLPDMGGLTSQFSLQNFNLGSLGSGGFQEIASKVMGTLSSMIPQQFMQSSGSFGSGLSSLNAGSSSGMLQALSDSVGGDSGSANHGMIDYETAIRTTD